MPRRLVPFVNGQIYHLFNRGVNKQEIFTEDRDYLKFVNTLAFYVANQGTTRYSDFLKLPDKRKSEFLQTLSGPKSTQLITYALMPNHYHLLIRQCFSEGISDLVRHTQDSYSKYFNIKYDRVGPLWQGQFKAVLITSKEQLLHVSRYIHLNPYTSQLTKNRRQFLKYRWSSLNEYLRKLPNSTVETETILSYFKTPEAYLKFVLDNADHQRQLNQIKHLAID